MMTYSFSLRTTLKLAAPLPKLRLLNRLSSAQFFFEALTEDICIPESFSFISRVVLYVSR